jgi:8-oxo-dGTP pyrophosphatase MutT (NUDIX family)
MMGKEPMKNRFVTTDTHVVHSWAMFRLLRRVVKDPHGESFERTYVSTPGAVATVAVTSEGDVVLVSQYRASFDSFVLEIPAGMRDIEDEDPAVTAVRELHEETGFSAQSVEELGECLSSPGVTDSSVIVYLAQGLTPGEFQPHGPEEEAMQTVLVPFSEALTMISDGRLTDAKSAYGILLAAHRHPHLVR